MSSASKNRLGLFAAALLFSTGGAAIKACSLSGWQVAGFRSGIAAGVLYVAIPGARRLRTRRTWLTGLAYAATLVLFVLATKATTSANAIFLQSTAPLYLLLLGPLVLREPIRKMDIAVIAAVAAGAFMLLLGSRATTSTAPDPALGNLLAVFSGATWALTLTGLRSTAKRAADTDSAAATVIAGNILSFAICMPMAVPVNHASLQDVILLLYLGIFQISLAYLLLTRSLRQVPGLEAATMLLIEPVLNPVWTWIIHGERLSSLALLGGGLIIAATLAGTAWQAKFTRNSQIGYTDGR